MIKNPQVLGLATDIRVQDLMSEVNAKRIQNGLSVLKENPQLDRAALLKAQDMFARGYWAHFAPDGKTPWAFIDTSGYHYKYAGENLARDFAVSKQVVDAWMNSPTHRKNILDSKFEDIGLAVVNGSLSGEETTLVVQIFGTEAKNAGVLTTRTILGTTNSGVETRPVFNVFGLTKKIAFVFGFFLIAVLYLDAVVVLKKKIYRISGNNFAHIILFLFLMLALYWSQYGAIL